MSIRQITVTEIQRTQALIVLHSFKEKLYVFTRIQITCLHCEDENVLASAQVLADLAPGLCMQSEVD